MKPQVIHSIHFPVSAHAFVYPMVKYLCGKGITSELWLEDSCRHNNIIQKIDIPKQLVDSDLTVNPFIFFRRLVNYRTRLRKAKPRVLHVHQSRASLIPLLAAYLEKIPYRIYHNHGLPYLGYRGITRFFLRSLEVANLFLSTHVLLVSHSNLKEARKDRLLREDEGYVIANGSVVGINVEDYRCALDNSFVERVRQELNIPRNSFVLGYIGRPVKRKGFHLLLKAWVDSGLAAKDHILLIAGCTEEECKKVLGHPIEGVKALGYIQEMNRFYSACDAVVLPSHHEGFSYALLEGSAAAKPLIGTDIPGNRCAIQDGITGFLIPPNDITALTQVIKTLASDPLLCLRLGKNARERAKSDFRRDDVLSGIVKFYNQNLALDLLGEEAKEEHWSI